MRQLSIAYPSANKEKWVYPHNFANLFLWNGLDKNGPGAEKGEPANCYVLNLNNQYRLDRALSEIKGGGVCVYDAIEPEIWDRVEKNSGYLLLDMSVECLMVRQDIAEGILRGLHDYAIDPDRLVIINSNIDSDKRFNEQFFHALPKRPKIIGFDSCFWLISGFNREKEKNSSSLQMRHATVRNNLNALRGKKFVSFNGRQRPHRFYVILWMLANDLMEEGHISFLGYQSKERTSATSSELEKYYLSHQYPYSDIIANQASRLLDKLPLVIDVSLEESQTGAAYKKNLPWISQSGSIYDDAFFSIVIDTEFNSKDSLFLTPIAYKSFMNLSPFIYFGNPGALTHMRQLGFKTFSPYIDESYDDVTDWRLRMKLALDEIDRLAGMSMQALRKLYIELWPVLEHNYWHIYREAPKSIIKNFQKEVFDPLGLNMET